METATSCRLQTQFPLLSNAIQKNILYGSVLKLSSLLNFLPPYFDFQDDDDKLEGDLSPKNKKRQKLLDKQSQFNQLLRPQNLIDEDSQPTFDSLPQLKAANQKKDSAKLYKKIAGEYFVDTASTKYQLRHINVIDVADIDVVIVSSYQELFGLPFITSQSHFKGRVIMTQPLHQIGLYMLLDFVRLNSKRNQAKDSGPNFFQQDQLHDIFAAQGISEWQDLYTEKDVESCFKNYTTILNFNEEHQYDDLLKLTPLPNGLHMGTANWRLDIGTHKLGILNRSSVESEFRYPLNINLNLLEGIDVLLVNSVIPQAINYKPSYSSQMKHLLEKLIQSLNSSLSAKVLMPVSPLFILEIVDLLLYKIDERVKIVFISEAASPIIQFSNINVEYLNLMLQNKIYNTENPFSFEKLLNQERLLVFKDIHEYIKYKQMQGSMFANEIAQEIILTSHSSLRLGESVYWLHNLNKHNPQNSCIVLTDPMYYDNEMLMKPFQDLNKIKVIHCPVDPGISMSQLNQIIKQIQPKRIVCPFAYQNPKAQVGITQTTSEKNSIVASSSTVVETIQTGQSLLVTEGEIGQLMYKGLCPTGLSNQIKLHETGDTRVGRLQGVDIEFRDQKYIVKDVQHAGDAKNREKLFFKLLNLKSSRENQNKQMFQLKSGISKQRYLENLAMQLELQGYNFEIQDISLEKATRVLLSDVGCAIEVDFENKKCSIESLKSIGQLKRISGIIKSVINLL